MAETLIAPVFSTILGTVRDENIYEEVSVGPGSGMRTLDVRIKVTKEVMRESGDFECGLPSSLYDGIRVRHQSSLADTSSSTSSDRGQESLGSPHDNIQEEDSEEESSQRSSLFLRVKTFKQKLSRKCINKITSFSIFK